MRKIAARDWEGILPAPGTSAPTQQEQAVSRAGTWFGKNVVDPTVNAVSGADKWLGKHVTEPISTAAANADRWLGKHVVAPVEDAATTAVQAARGGLNGAVNFITGNGWNPHEGMFGTVEPQRVDPVYRVANNATKSVTDGLTQLPRLAVEVPVNSVIRATSQLPKAVNWVAGNGYNSDWADRVRKNMYISFDSGNAADTGWGADLYWDSGAANQAAKDFGASVWDGWAARPAAALSRGVGNIADAVFDSPEFKKSTHDFASGIESGAKDLYSDDLRDDPEHSAKVDALALVNEALAAQGAGKALGAVAKPAVSAASSVPVAGKALAVVPKAVGGAMAAAPAAAIRSGTRVPAPGEPGYEQFKLWDNMMLFGKGGALNAAGNLPGEAASLYTGGRDLEREAASIVDEAKRRAWSDETAEQLGEEFSEIDRSVGYLERELGHAPTDEEIAKDTKIPAYRVQMIRQVLADSPDGSFDEETGARYPTGDELRALLELEEKRLVNERGWKEYRKAQEELKQGAMTTALMSMPFVGNLAKPLGKYRIPIVSAAGGGVYGLDQWLNNGKLTKDVTEEAKQFSQLPGTWLQSWAPEKQ